MTGFFQYAIDERKGGMSEWLKEAVLKTVVSQGTVGSNPTPSARKCNIITFHEKHIVNGDPAYAEFAERWPSWLKALAC